ncbi:MAG: VOC family protein [Alphaproteobacteria bacterium]|nr:VOC family protein [Alphaproteobacteria bacterium]
MTRIDHIGIVVADIEAAIPHYRKIFGEVHERREMAEAGIRIATFEAENVTVELLQHTGGGDGAARELLGIKPGLSHLAAQVDDVPTAMNELSAAGFRVRKGFPRQGLHGPVAFFEEEDEMACLFEVCEHHQGDQGT